MLMLLTLFLMFQTTSTSRRWSVLSLTYPAVGVAWSSPVPTLLFNFCLDLQPVSQIPAHLEGNVILFPLCSTELLILWRSLFCYKRLCSVEDFQLTRGNFTSLVGPNTEKWFQSMSILNSSAVSPSVTCVNDTLLRQSLWRPPQSMLCALTVQRRHLRSPKSFAT